MEDCSSSLQPQRSKMHNRSFVASASQDQDAWITPRHFGLRIKKVPGLERGADGGGEAVGGSAGLCREGGHVDEAVDQAAGAVEGDRDTGGAEAVGVGDALPRSGSKPATNT